MSTASNAAPSSPPGMKVSPMTEQSAVRAGVALPGGHLWLWMLLFYAAHLAIRILVGPGLNYDDAEQVMVGTQWSWGYGPQPPLYTWLVLAISTLFGDMRSALFITRFGLLFLTCLFAWLLARRLAKSRPGIAMAGGLAPLLVPWVAFECNYNHSHTLAAMAATLMTAWAFVGVVEQRRWVDYGLLALAISTGCLSKMNYAVILPPLFAAALSITDTRRAVLNSRMGACLLTAAALVTPAAIWMLDHRDVMMSRAYRLQAAGEWSPVIAGRGAGLFVLNVAAVVGPALATLWFVLRWRVRQSSAERAALPERTGIERCLARAAGGTLLLGLVLVLASGTANVNGHWLVPWCLPVAVLAASHWSARTTGRRLRLLGRAGVAVAAVSLAVPPLRTALLIHSGGTAPNEAVDFAGAARTLESAHPLSGVTILTHELHTAGNLSLFAPGARALTPEYSHLSDAPGGAVLLIWTVHGEAVPEPPAVLRDFYRSRYGHAPPEAAIQTLSIPVFNLRAKPRVLAYMFVTKEPHPRPGLPHADRPSAETGGSRARSSWR